MSLTSGFVEVTNCNAYFASDTVTDDMLIRTGSNFQRIVFATLSTSNSTMILSNNIVSFASNVGIGKSNPAYALDVNGTINATNLYVGGLPYSGGGGGGQWSSNAANIYTIGSNVGIGTATPSESLQSTAKIYGQVQILGTSNDSVSIPAFSWKENSNTGIFHASNNMIGFTTGGTERVRITDLGYIGVGTSNPGSFLSVAGGATIGAALSNSTAPANGIMVQGPTSLCNNLSVYGTATVSNITTLQSNLVVAGPATFSNNVYVLNPVSFSNTFNVSSKADFSNAVTITSNLWVNGATSLSNNLNVYGSATVSNITTLQSNLVVAGLATFSNNVYVLNPTSLSNTLNVSSKADFSNAVTITSNLWVNGAASLSNNLNVYGTATVSNTTTLQSNLVVAGLATFSNDVTVIGKLSVSNVTYITSNIQIYANEVVQSNLSVYQAATLCNNLTIYGTTIHSNVTVLSSNLTFSNYGSVICYTSNSYLGIGISNPSYKLDVVGDINYTGTLRSNGVAFGGTNQWTSSTANIYITGSNVGIGTTSPTSNLHVVGSSLFNGITAVTSADTWQSTFNIANTSSSMFWQFLVGGSLNGPTAAGIGGFAIYSGSSFKFNINSNGNVGIAKTNPAYLLDVAGDINFTGTLRSNGVAFTGGGGTQWTSSGANIYITASNVGIGTTAPTESLHSTTKIYSQAQVLGTSNDAVGIPAFSWKENSNTGMFHASNNTIGFSTGGTEYVRVTDLGYVGIGTSNPGSLLSIAGGATIGAALSNSTAPVNGIMVQGATSLCNNLNVYGTTTVSNVTTLQSNLVVAGPATFSNNVYVLNPTSLSNTLNVSSKADFSNAVTITSNLWVNGAASLSNNLNVYGTTIVSNVTTLQSNLVVAGLATFSNNVYVLNPTSLSNTLNVSSKADFSNAVTITSNLWVNGATSLCNNLNIYGTTTVSNVTTLQSNLVVAGLATFSNDVTVIGKLSVSNVTYITSNIQIYANEVVQSNLSVYQAATLCNSLTIYGTTIQSNITVLSSNLTFSNYGAVTCYTSNSYLGIGISNPAYKLDVAGDINFTGTLRSNGIAFTGGGGGTSSQWTSSGANIYITASNVGIGTTAPTESLHSTTKIYSQVQLLGNSNDNITVPSFSWKENSNTGMYHPSNNMIGFTTGGVERMRVTDLGYIGIGLSNPTNPLHIKAVNGYLAIDGSNGYTGLSLSASNQTTTFGIAYIAGQYSTFASPTDLIIRNQSPSGKIHLQNGIAAAALTIHSNNMVGIGTSNPIYPLQVTTQSNNVSISATYDIVAFSDARVKKDLVRISDALEKINEINGYTFARIDSLADPPSQSKSRYAGVVAQEVAKVLPEVVHEDADGMMSVAYGNMAALFIEAIKGLKQEIKGLEQDIKKIKDHIGMV